MISLENDQDIMGTSFCSYSTTEENQNLEEEDRFCSRALSLSVLLIIYLEFDYIRGIRCDM